MATGARIIGLEKLQKKLSAMPKLVKQEIRKALEQSAEEIVSLAKSLVPVDKGDLRDSIGWTYGDVPKGSIALGSVKASEITGDLTITVYAGNSQAFYARWQEFGTQKMQAQPFFYPAYRALRRRSKGRVTRAINKAAKKIAASR
jgi:HK97 gp10 family phage protein